MRFVNSILCLVVVSLSARSADAAIVTIHDRVFDPATWTVSILGGSNVRSASLTQLPNQGVTGDAQQTTISGTGPYTFDVQQFKLDRPFVTTSDGIIQSVSWEIWYKVENASQVASWRLAARQGGDTFIARSTFFEPNDFSVFWQQATGLVPVSDFGRATGTGSPSLNTSVGGEPIEFGYVLSRGFFRSGTTSYRASFLNLNIATTPIPEPAFLSCAAGFAGIIALRRSRMETR